MHYEFEEGEKERVRKKERKRKRAYGIKETFVIFTKIHRLIFSRYDIF